MASLRLLVLAPTLVCFLSACTVATDDATSPNSTQAAAGEVGGSSGEGGSDNARSQASGSRAGGAGKSSRSVGAGTAGQSARPSDGHSGTSESTGDETTGTVSSAGSSNLSSGGAGLGEPASTEPVSPPQSCDLDNGCVTDCEENSVTCDIASTNVACEFEGFTGATAQVACGRRVVIGMACCGGCGCVPVEVFFDGNYCWQGVPRCEGGALGNKMLFPHAPTTSNLSYTLPSNVPGSFYLGSGGFAGSGGSAGSSGSAGREATGGTAGTASGAGTSGGGMGGAPQQAAGARSMPEAGEGGAL